MEKEKKTRKRERERARKREREREREMVQYESGDDTMHEAAQIVPGRTGRCM